MENKCESSIFQGIVKFVIWEHSARARARGKPFEIMMILVFPLQVSWIMIIHKPYLDKVYESFSFSWYYRNSLEFGIGNSWFFVWWRPIENFGYFFANQFIISIFMFWYPLYLFCRLQKIKTQERRAPQAIFFFFFFE